jgi:probable phosphoglycerate mutase
MTAKRPTLYYIRHGETDWNVERRLQGQKDIPLNARGRAQARHCGEILRDLLARDGRDPAGNDYVSSPLSRARVTMELARTAMGLPPDAYSVDPQLTEISFGAWEGYTIAEMRQRDPQGTVQREQDKWHFQSPGGESYKMVAARMGAWYETLTRDTVAAAHGGTARGLMAYLGIAKAAAAPLIDIEQGVVYVFEGGKLSRYA